MSVLPLTDSCEKGGVIKTFHPAKCVNDSVQMGYTFQKSSLIIV